jgi:hypothetical protein
VPHKQRQSSGWRGADLALAPVPTTIVDFCMKDTPPEKDAQVSIWKIQRDFIKCVAEETQSLDYLPREWNSYSQDRLRQTVNSLTERYEGVEASLTSK